MNKSKLIYFITMFIIVLLSIVLIYKTIINGVWIALVFATIAAIGGSYHTLIVIKDWIKG